MLVSDLRHFLDMAHDVPGPARRMGERLSLIVRAATAGDAGIGWVSALTCDRRPGHKSCPGHLALFRSDIPASIEWRCTACGDEGVISGWERSPFDLRRRHGDSRSVDILEVVVPSDVVATLRTLLLLDTTAERIVFQARVSAEGIVLAADEDDLNELTDHLAAESNHEHDCRRQKRLDRAEPAARRCAAPRTLSPPRSFASVALDDLLEDLLAAHHGAAESGEHAMVVGMATRKVTVTLDELQLDQIRRLVEDGGAPSVSGFVQHAVASALDDVAGWGALLDGALRDTGGPLSDDERGWADEQLGTVPGRRS